MLEIKKLYRSYEIQKKYKDINEEKILTSLYAYTEGTLEEVISKIINLAVLAHMDLAIDSTIMQFHALNEYLSRLFMKNFDNVIYNYCIDYLIDRHVEKIDELKEREISALPKAVNMKTELSDLRKLLIHLCEK